MSASDVLRAVATIAAIAIPRPAGANLTIPSDGSDGAFNPTTNTVIDLFPATVGAWNTSNFANAGRGVYDPSKWAVVFKYSSVNIPGGVTVTFKNHPSYAPVVWLVQGDVTINGSVSLDGGSGTGGNPTEPGPGGFRGGGAAAALTAQSAGYGPGGGSTTTPRAGAYSGTYGNASLMPLIGGSGAAGAPAGYGYSGGSGGGAILIAAGGTIAVGGALSAKGGCGTGSCNSYTNTAGGSGGGIRLIADAVTGTGSIYAYGGDGSYWGGDGVIRVETNSPNFSGSMSPTPSTAFYVDPNPTIWPDSTVSGLTIIQVGTGSPPADPHGSLQVGSQDVTINASSSVSVTLSGKNVPTTWTVDVRVVPRSGPEQVARANFVSGNATSSVWQAMITPPQGFCVLQARAHP